MTIYINIFLCILFLNSCSSIDLKRHSRIDEVLTAETLSIINGLYKAKKSNKYNSWVKEWGIMPIYPYYNIDLFLNVTVINKGKIEIRIQSKDFVYYKRRFIRSITEGYYNTSNMNFRSEPLAPLLWGFSISQFYIGLTTENELVVIRNTGGSAILVLFPVMMASFQNSEYYERVDEMLRL